MAQTAFALICLVSALSLVASGPVHKSISCGGTGAFLKLSIGDCDGETESCIVPIAQSTPVSISFVSQETTDDVQFQVWFYRPFGSVSPLLDVTTEGLSLVAGSEYEVGDFVTVPERFIDVIGEFAIMLIDRTTDTRISCGEASVTIVNATRTH